MNCSNCCCLPEANRYWSKSNQKQFVGTWRQISQTVLPFSSHHLCTHLLCANWNSKQNLIQTKDAMPAFWMRRRYLQFCFLKRNWIGTLRDPQHAQGDSMLVELSGSSSWQILHWHVLVDEEAKSSSFMINPRSSPSPLVSNSNSNSNAIVSSLLFSFLCVTKGQVPRKEWKVGILESNRVQLGTKI